MSAKIEKIALFIDGANLHATAKSLGFEIDYKRLLSEFQLRGYLLRALYYTAVVEDHEYPSIRPLIDWLDYNGYAVVTKAAKESVDQTGRRKIKGNMDVELAVDAMEIAPHIDQMVLFSGDGDFRSLVEAVQRRGARVFSRLAFPSKLLKLTPRESSIRHKRVFFSPPPAQTGSRISSTAARPDSYEYSTEYSTTRLPATETAVRRD